MKPEEVFTFHSVDRVTFDGTLYVAYSDGVGTWAMEADDFDADIGDDIDPKSPTGYTDWCESAWCLGGDPNDSFIAQAIANMLQRAVDLRGGAVRIEPVTPQTVASAIFNAGARDDIEASVNGVSNMLIGEWTGVDTQAVVDELSVLLIESAA